MLNDVYFLGLKGGMVYNKYDVKFLLNDYEMIVFYYVVFLICNKYWDCDFVKVGDIMKKRIND